MRLLLFINSLASGGAERVLSKLANHWAQQGHEVVLATLTPECSDHYAVDESVDRVSLQGSSFSSSFVEALKSNGVRWWRLRRLIRERQPDVVVTFMPTANLLAYLAGLGLSVPVVMSERSHPPNFPMRQPRRWLQGLIYPRAAKLVVLTQSSAQWLQSHLGCQNILVVANAVSLPLARHEPIFLPSDYVPEHVQMVLTVGRLDHNKQMDHVVRNFAQCSCDDAHLVLIGQGPEQGTLERMVVELGIAERVHFVSQVGNVEDWYTRADIFVTASRLEGFPNVLLEAMACGCACVAYDCPTGPADIINHDENGFLVPLNDEAELKRRLQVLLEDSVVATRLSNAAEQVVETFSDGHFFAQWDALILQWEVS